MSNVTFACELAYMPYFSYVNLGFQSFISETILHFKGQMLF